jgi:hypothetical protein
MAVLTPQQRNTLESAVKNARTAAEQGAFNALHSLGIDNTEPFAHLSADERTLRNRLRNKGRLLGDDLTASGDQNISHLCYELAYETWHKMLFAKFLEANDLLMHTDGVAVTLDDCEELAREENFVDKWDAAANYASNMLPAIFRTDDPLMQVPFATNDRIKLEGIIDALETSIFTAEDALGWVYQFWQSDEKKRINATGDPIDGAKLPAVTQLFTEPYMVNFLIDNTIGAWWVSRNPGITSPVKFEYLRLLDNGTPAAGNFEGWPNKTVDITSLDPCMGSGHFIASLFPVFATLRMYEEGLTKEDATDLVIAENLHGLELDARCTQIAAFNLALTAWKFCGHYKTLPEMNLACSGIAPKGKVEDWIKLVETANDERLINGMQMLYDHFQLAPELGSLLDPSTIKADAFTAGFNELQPYLAQALANEVDKDQIERGVMAAGIAKAGEILAQKYTLLITNVPYLTRGKQDEVLHDYCDVNYLDAKGDLANVFLEKMLKSNSIGGVSCTVMPQNWLFLSTYKKLRIKLLTHERWQVTARLGSGAFSQITGEVVKAILIIIQHKKPDVIQDFTIVDVSLASSIYEKVEGLKNADLKIINQLSQLKNPDARIVFADMRNSKPLISKIAESGGGASSFDSPRFMQEFCEQPIIDSDIFILSQSSPSNRKIYSGRSGIFKWEKGQGGLYDLMQAKKEIENYSSGIWSVWSRFIGKKGICVGMMGDIAVTLFDGKAFDNNTGVIIPTDEENLSALWAYCSSDFYREDLRKIDQKLNVTSGTLVKVPFDLEYWQNVADEKYPNGLPKPYSDDATQWLFHGHPIKSDNPLQVAVARLLSYRWPAENDSEMELADEARELIAAVKAFDGLSDDDGIFCIPSVNGEEAGADRVRGYLQAVYGKQWNNSSLSALFTKEGASSSNLDEWLRKEFFVQHCKLFQNRPFIWHIWDGRVDGFSALVNYHTLTKDNLSRLTHTYLGDWIRQCIRNKEEEKSGAEGLLSAALKLKEKLELILAGEAPYDIFVRWKPLSEQPIGWEPDLNDGVRLNVRPFVEAGVLRSKFNVKWGIDRGKNPAGSYWGEIRDNDTHLSLEEKRKAREEK